MGVLRVFGGCCRVFGKIKYRYEIRQTPPPFTKLVHKLVNPYGQPDPKKTVFLWPPLAILVAGSNDAKSPSLELQLQLQRVATC